MAFPWLAVQAPGTLGHLLLELGDTLGAERKIAEARGHLTTLSPAGALTAWVDGLAAAVDKALAQSLAEEASTLKERESQQRRLGGVPDRGLLPVHLQLQPPFDHAADALEHPLSGSFAAHEDPKVIGVADEPVTAFPQLPVQIIQHDIRQDR